MSKRFSGPKRRIERVINQVVTTSFANTLATAILHTCEDSKTLVRMIIKLRVVPLGTTAGDVRALGLISVAPGGTSVNVLVSTQSLDTPARKQELWRDTTVYDIRSDIGVIMPTKWDSDIKSMRKLTENDEITLQLIASSVQTWSLIGVIVLFFKE